MSVAVKKPQDDPNAKPPEGDPGDGQDGGSDNPSPGGDGGQGDGAGQTGSDGKEGPGGKGSPGGSLEDLPEWAQKEITKLRTENASSRTKAKATEDRLGKIETGLKSIFGESEDGEELSPEEKLEQVQAQNHGVAFENAMLELCLDKGLTDKDDRKYLSFLVTEAAEELEDDEELSEETLDELIQKAKSRGAGKKASSSPDSDGDTPPNPEGDDVLTVEKFSKMNALEKNQLYTENPDVYTKLANEAKKKGMFV